MFDLKAFYFESEVIEVGSQFKLLLNFFGIELEFTFFANRKPLGKQKHIEGLKKWCARKDLNLHGIISHQALNLARLPIPTLARFEKSGLVLPQIFASATLSSDFSIVELGVRGA